MIAFLENVKKHTHTNTRTDRYTLTHTYTHKNASVLKVVCFFCPLVDLEILFLTKCLSSCHVLQLPSDLFSLQDKYFIIPCIVLQLNPPKLPGMDFALSSPSFSLFLGEGVFRDCSCHACLLVCLLHFSLSS